MTEQRGPSAAVYKLDASHTDAAVAVLARAFSHAPMWTWALPDEQHRKRALPLSMRRSFLRGVILDAAYGIGDPLYGVAIWAPPGMAEANVDPDGSRTGGDAVVADAVGAQGTRRFDSMSEVQRPLHERHAKADGWYLSLLAVDPDAQRTGMGSALLCAMWSRLDPQHVSTYTETANVANVPYYKSRGYEVMYEGALPDGGPRYFYLSRQPKRHP
jgi:ribosomal protein S18 acetylase RimI-like enzyme